MDTILLTALIKKYDDLMTKENAYHNYVATSDKKSEYYYWNLPERPSKAEINSLGRLIRKETLILEQKFNDQYWGRDK